MKVQIIYCHPSKKSYTYDVLTQLVENLQKENIKYEISDLYAMEFRSDMDEMEYEREGLADISLPIAEDVKSEQQKLEESDCIVFIYPVWWSDCPAKLKGWFDRVYSLGYAYGEFDQIKKMKTLKYGLVLCTAGHSVEYLKEIGIAESMRNVMLDDRLGKRFLRKEMVILGGTTEKEKVRHVHEALIKSVGKKIKGYCT